MWKQFWKTAPLAGILIIMMVGAIAADYGLKLGYVFPQESAQESELIPDASIKPRPENSSQGQSSQEFPGNTDSGNESSDQAPESQSSSEESSMNEESSGMPADESSQMEESSQESSSSDGSSSSEGSSSETSQEESSSTEESSDESSSEESNDSAAEESSGNGGNSEESSEESSSGSSSEGSSSEESSQTSKPSNDDEEGIISAYSPYAYVERDPAPPLSGFYDDPGRRALDTPCDYFTADDSYFEDALFIGDSRIEGLALYGAMPSTSFLYMHGINVFTLETADDLVFKYQGVLISKETTEATALSSYQFKKIYIMLGINEIGIGNQNYFAEQYAHIVETIQSYQPDAIIIIMGILNMTEEYTLGQSVFNNDNINSRNYQLSLLADGSKVFYIDCNPAVWDPETEALSSAYSSDGVHLRTEYYYLWRDYLYTRAIDPEHPH